MSIHRPFIALVAALFALCSLVACSDPIEVYQADAAQIEQFHEAYDRIALADAHGSPLAGLVWPTNQVGSPLGMRVWGMDPLLRSFGLRNGDVITRINNVDIYGEFEERWKETGQPYAKGQFNQGPNHLQSEKYADFAAFLIELGRKEKVLELQVHQRNNKKAEREKHGGLFVKKPRFIQVDFGNAG